VVAAQGGQGKKPEHQDIVSHSSHSSHSSAVLLRRARWGARSGLPWAFPGWVGNGTGSPFADGGALTSNYILQWCVLPQVWPALLKV